MKLLESELLKLLYARATKVVLILVCVVQGILAYSGSRQILQVGLDATPLTCDSLAEAIPPVDYIGFDAVLFGMVPLIVLGALAGSFEFKRKCFRTTFLTSGSRGKILVTKILTVIGVSTATSFLSTYITLNLAQGALGGQGLPVILLNKTTWGLIFLSVLSEVLLILTAFGMALTFHTATVPLLFMIPQLYVSMYLPKGYILASLLPIPAGESLIGTSPQVMNSNPASALLVLLCWSVCFLVIGCVRLGREDMGNYEE